MDKKPNKFDGFESYTDVLSQFRAEHEAIRPLTDADVLCAQYDQEDYSGSAWVVFAHDTKLYEVNASHCSCYGLEDQWSPEETTVAAILMRPKVEDALRLALAQWMQPGVTAPVVELPNVRRGMRLEKVIA